MKPMTIEISNRENRAKGAIPLQAEPASNNGHEPEGQPAPPQAQPGRGARIVLALLLCAAAGFGGYGLGRSGSAGPSSGTVAKAAQYHCPMHPTVVQDQKGSCPICGMDLVPIEDSKPAGVAATSPDQPTRYHCPMHPAVVQDQKGSCPICGMDLVPIQKGLGEAADPRVSIPGLAAVSITSEIRQRMGLTTGAVEKRSLSREIRTSARIVLDETQQFKVTTKIEGWVEKLFVNITGQSANQGDPLLTIYSPELVSAQEEYLVARQLAASEAANPVLGGEKLLAAARRRLQLWDISEGQIQRLETTRQAERTMTLFAPAGGVVIEKNVLAGQKIMPGEPLLVIANLTNVWADADLYPPDLPYVKMGMPVEVTLPYWPDKVFKGTVTFISPTLDAATRTVKARLNIENPGLLLKPEMYANARLAWPLGETLAIPEAAVMRTGEHTYAFKDGGEGKLIPVEIRIGPRAEGYFQLLDGLKAGDRVVTSANFLVDSESSLKAALSAMSKSSETATAPDTGGHPH